jgi:hypothetical protein
LREPVEQVGEPDLPATIARLYWQAVGAFERRANVIAMDLQIAELRMPPQDVVIEFDG